MAIRFSDPKLYLKGIAVAYLQDEDGNIVYYDDKFTEGQVSTSSSDGMIRAGLGNGVAAMIPTDSALTVSFNAADFSLFIKAAQVGSKISMGAPVMTCQDVTAAETGATLQIDISAGAPVAPIGFHTAIAFVQEIGKNSFVRTDGTAYPISDEGVVSGLSVTGGTQYKVTYFINQANAQVAAISSVFDPAVYRLTIQYAVYSSENKSKKSGTRVGSLWQIVSRMKFDGANGGVNGSQTANDTSMITGQALTDDYSVVEAGCDDCGAIHDIYGYYIYVPCDLAEGIEDVVVEYDGIIEMPINSSYQLSPSLVVNGELVHSIDPNSFTYEITPDTAATTVTDGGLLRSGATAEDAEVVVGYESGGKTFSSRSIVSVTANT